MIELAERYGKLTPIGEPYKAAHYLSDRKRGKRRWLVRARCDCGTEKVFVWSELKRGRTTSCGCKARGFHDSMMAGWKGQRRGIETV